MKLREKLNRPYPPSGSITDWGNRITAFILAAACLVAGMSALAVVITVLKG